LGSDVPKQYLQVGGRTLLECSVAPLAAADWIDEVIVVVAPGDARVPPRLAALPRVRVLAAGGATRRDTVLNALNALTGAAEDDWVLVHDAARPGLDADALGRLRAALADAPVGGLLALAVVDTVKRAVPDGERPMVATTVARDGMWLAQTPQMFRLGLLRAALRAHPGATDESSALEAMGHRPLLVPGSLRNFKVTTADDLAAMRRVLGEE